MGQGNSAGTETTKRRVSFYYNGRRVSAFEGDTVACALVRAGVHIFSRSMKFHRPRGLYCGNGRCISCAMRVDGVPWVRTCTTLVADGMVVESQGGLPSVRLDALSMADHVFRNELEYRTRFIRPRALTPLYQRAVRWLAASSRMPDRSKEYPQFSRRNCSVLVVGQGTSGSTASSRLRRYDIKGVVSVDLMTGSEDRIPAAVFGAYEGGEFGIQVGGAVQIVKPEVVLLATGRFETGLPLVNGDLPGVLLPGALAQLSSRGIPPGRAAVLIGSNERRSSVLKDLAGLGVTVAGTADSPSGVSRVIGRARVKGVELSGGRKVACDTVVVMGPLVPAVELAQQAGCELDPRNGLIAVRVDDSGRTSRPSIFACGSVAGYTEHADRISSAEKAADAIADDLGVR